MYYDSKLDRLLLNDGRSIVSESTYIKLSLSEKLKSNTYIPASFDTSAYRDIYGEDMSFDENVSNDPTPSELTHTDKDVDDIVALLQASSRYEPTVEFDDRIVIELEYFCNTNNIVFLKKIHEMIVEFKRDGVVWGVGRGSCCSSLVLFLLDVHDVNPLYYDIPFSELSKEQETRF